MAVNQFLMPLFAVKSWLRASCLVVLKLDRGSRENILGNTLVEGTAASEEVVIADQEAPEEIVVDGQGEFAVSVLDVEETREE